MDARERNQRKKGIAPNATTLWSGQSVTGSDTLVMFTYAGDANLDGTINVDDYYGVIDFNIGIQGAPFPTGSDISVGSATAVPEPAGAPSLSLAVTAAAFRSRRRRRMCRQA